MSKSIELYPFESTNLYWAKIIRCKNELPMPSTIHYAQDMPGPFLQQGLEELFEGDFLFEGEERKSWIYTVTWMSGSICAPDKDVKRKMKEAGMSGAVLSGSGPLAACIRVAWGVKDGFYAINRL